MMLAATLLGIIAGLVIGEPITSTKFLGDIFLYLLQFVVGPLVFVSIAWLFNKGKSVA
ncbi:MAG: cation:dicarboxylase symporter family transporter [Sulfolobales archaeon]